MIIKDKKKELMKYTFGAIFQGDVFEFNGDLYLKTNNSGCNYLYNAYNLSHNYNDKIDRDEIVKPLKTELNILGYK